MCNVAVVSPKTGTSLWADPWVFSDSFVQSQLPRDLKLIRSGAKLEDRPSVVHEWIELRLQAARALPFKQEVIPGATPSDIGVPNELAKCKPKLGTNLIAEVHPPDIFD
ncbi:hypothetical protein NC653_001441 [Populus alba x Populus x berolinensis]|uniref:Uncharacterized protein n=1 Tax=Populus alba x Populus x berolinensis TaxID=444605 RepID=A0AAD6RL33_9ROSI|nr:hypothetical protein NC653_001441 [Populus alba x Populus x berolinensis]